MAWAARGPWLDGLHTWLGALPSPSEVLKFLTRGPTFSFCTQPRRLHSQASLYAHDCVMSTSPFISSAIGFPICRVIWEISSSQGWRASEVCVWRACWTGWAASREVLPLPQWFFLRVPQTWILTPPGNTGKKKVKSESEVAQSCLTLCDTMGCSLWGSSVHGIFLARVLEWVAISFSKGSSRPRDRIWVFCIAGRCFYRLNHQATQARRRDPKTQPS